jgi:CRISPR/Cas system-associated exonuclease Cas4 (RecB family)
MSIRNYKLSPSDFAFIWEECKRCFYLKIVSGFSRPRSIMPSIFKVIDGEMNKELNGKRLESVVSGIQPGVVQYGEQWVESQPISIPGKNSTCFIKGRFDTVVKFDDGTYGVIDFKTSKTRLEHIPLYARQLHAYAYALENSAPGALSIKPMSKLGLLIYEPNKFSVDKINSGLLSGGVTWIEIPRNNSAFLNFLKEIITILEKPEPPEGSPTCEWCQYRGTSRRTGL